MACAVIAADPSLRGESDGTTSDFEDETERRRAQLAKACRLLEKAGEKSPMALKIVRRLVGVLRRHCIDGIQGEKVSKKVQETQRPEVSTTFINSGDTASKSQEYHDGQEAVIDAVRSGLIQQQPQHRYHVDGGSWAYDPAPDDPNALTGIWNDFLGTDPANGDWEQLFTDLDYFSGGM